MTSRRRRGRDRRILMGIGGQGALVQKGLVRGLHHNGPRTQRSHSHQVIDTSPRRSSSRRDKGNRIEYVARNRIGQHHVERAVNLRQCHSYAFVRRTRRSELSARFLRPTVTTPFGSLSTQRGRGKSDASHIDRLTAVGADFYLTLDHNLGARRVGGCLWTLGRRSRENDEDQAQAPRASEHTHSCKVLGKRAYERFEPWLVDAEKKLIQVGMRITSNISEPEGVRAYTRGDIGKIVQQRMRIHAGRLGSQWHSATERS